MKDRQRILFAFMGIWEEHGIAGTVHGQSIVLKQSVIGIGMWANEIPKEILGLVTCKISQDSITCEYIVAEHISIIAKIEKIYT